MTKNVLIVLLTALTINACNSSNSKMNIKLEHTDFTVILEDSIRVGLNKVSFDSKGQPIAFQILANTDSILTKISDNSVYFPFSSDLSYRYLVNEKEIELPTSSLKKQSAKNDSLWVAILSPKTGEYGIQPLEYQLFRKKMNSWVQSTKKVYLLPWMNMGNGYGHSSQFNEQAQLVDSLGHQIYRGKISFSMPGQWDIKFIDQSDTLITTVQVKPAASN